MWRFLFSFFVLCGIIFSAPIPAYAKTPLIIVSVDTRGLDKQSFRQFHGLSLFHKLLARLTQAGFAVVGTQIPAQIRISFQAKNKKKQIEKQLRYQVFVLSEPSFSSTGLLVLKNRSVEQFHLELIHKVVGAARDLRWKLHQKQRTKKKKSHHRTQAKTPSKIALSKKYKLLRRLELRRLELRRLEWKLKFDVGVMGLYRIDSIDLLLRVGGRWGQEQGLGLYTSLFFSPSVTDSLTVVDWGIQVGSTWRQPLSSVFFLETGFLVGFGNHIFFLDEGLNQKGVHWDFVGNFVLLGDWILSPFVGLRIWSSVGFSQQSRVHYRGKLILWKRSFLRFEGGLSFFLRV